MTFGHLVESAWVSPLGQQFSNFSNELMDALSLQVFVPDYSRWGSVYEVSFDSCINLKNLSEQWLAVLASIDVDDSAQK